ncbi:MAG: response regulator transcription factor [Bacteroidales bacterium]|nr:response regulator transcription factor [Bacteroidales bacterium]
MTNRVLICEPSEIISIGLTEIIQKLIGFDVVSRLDTTEHLNERILTSDINVLILNPSLLGYSERSLIPQLTKDHPHLTVIALVTTLMDPSWLKSYHGVIEINDSRLSITNKLNEIVQHSEKQDKTNDDVELSKREIDVLVAVAKGMMNKEIADKMNISIHTVISHRKNITKKTGIKSVAGLTVYAMINGLIES